jgi:hypothetical protein
MRWIACTTLLLLAAAAPAAAGGMNLSWEQCAGAGTISNQVFACQSGAGAETLVGSFVTSISTGSGGIVWSLEFQTPTNAAMPGWVASTACVTASLTPAPLDSALDAPCVDWSRNAALANVTGFLFPDGSVNRARVTFAGAGTPSALAPGVEYVAFRLRIPHAVLLDPQSCGGCQQRVLIQFSRCECGQTLQLGLTPTSNQVLWQGGGPVATRQTSFAAIKSLYRY